MRVGGVVIPNPNVATEVTGALETPEVGLCPDPSVGPEDNIHPIPSSDGSAPSQDGIFACGAIPSVFL